MVLTCPKCNWEGPPDISRSGPHFKASCNKCGSYIKFLSKKEVIRSSELPTTVLEPGSYTIIVDEVEPFMKLAGLPYDPQEDIDYESIRTEPEEKAPWEE